MQEMADETGGRAFVNTNDLTGAIRESCRGFGRHVHIRVLLGTQSTGREIP